MSHSQSSEHFVMQLNNWLQVNGGTRRLNWNKAQYGPQHQPLWHVVCFIDGISYGEGDGYNLGEAREHAARIALEALTL